MLIERQSAVDRDPLNPGIEIGCDFFGIGGENLGGIPQPFEIWQVPLGDERVHQHRAQLIELE